MLGVLKMRIKELFILILLFSVSCESEFNPNIYSNSVPVVYGLINPDDSLYCIKLLKSFVCEQSFYECAQNEDLQYYDNPSIELEVLDDKGRLLNRGKLNPIIHDDKEPGIFIISPNIIYGITRKEIELEVDRGALRSIRTANLVLKINIPGYPHLVYSESLIRISPNIQSPPANIAVDLNFFSEISEKITWWGYTDDYHEIVYRIHYSEVYSDTVLMKMVSLNQTVTQPDSKLLSYDVYTHKVDGSIFLKKLAESFNGNQESTGLKHRKFESIDIMISSVGQDYIDYVGSINHDSDFEIKETSNIINGLGIFAVKRISYSLGHDFQSQSLDSIANSPTTKHLKFIKW